MQHFINLHDGRSQVERQPRVALGGDFFDSLITIAYIILPTQIKNQLGKPKKI